MYKKVLVAAAVAACLVGCTKVDTGHVGVYTKFGAILPGNLQPGAYWAFTDYNPTTTDIVQLDVRTQKWDGKAEAYTKDTQRADIEFVANYHLDPSKVDATFAHVGEDWANKLVAQDVYQQIKAEIGKYNANDLVSQQQLAATEIETRITPLLATKNVILDSWRMTDLSFTKEFEAAVEAKVIAQQTAIQEQNKTVQIHELATQAIETAKGKAEATVLAATAEAQSISIRAKALEANPKLVEWEAVQKWDGQLPTYSMGNATPFIQIPNQR